MSHEEPIERESVEDSSAFNEALEAIDSDRLDRLPEVFADLHAGDAALLIAALPEERHEDVMLALPESVAAGILEQLPDDQAVKLVMGMSPESAAPIIQEMRSDEETDLLQGVSSEHAERILRHFDAADASVARSMLAYDEDSAGGLMESEYIAFPTGMSSSEVVEELRRGGSRYRGFSASYLYVVDERQRFVGVISMRDLIMCEEETPVDTLMIRDALAVPADMPGQELVKLFRRYHYLAIPVVDEARRLIGVVTHDDVLQFVERDADEEMLRLSGIVGGDEFRDMKLGTRSWRRLSWLSINVLLNVAAASVIAFYQETIQAVVALAVFLPIISDMSGCSGNQAIAVSIRELSLDRISPRNALWVFRKEFLVGLINGLVLGLIVAAIAWWWKGSPMLGLVVGVALWVNTLVAVTIGGLVPLVLRRFRQDPALASGPILTTLTDMCGFFIVLALAARYVVP